MTLLGRACNFSVLICVQDQSWSRAVTAICVQDTVWILDETYVNLSVLLLLSNREIVWAVKKAEAGLGTPSRRAERLLIQHSSSSDLNMATASLRLHLCVYKCGLLKPGSLSLLHTFHCRPACEAVYPAG